MAEIRVANAQLGHHFFDADSMKFFRSRIESGVIGGQYFVSSEQFIPTGGAPWPRRYTIRVARANGAIDTVQSHVTRKHALAAAQLLAYRDAGDLVILDI